jgi:flagellar basal body-associated protein FliL
MKQKGFSLLILLVLAALVVIVTSATAYYLHLRPQNTNTNTYSMPTPTPTATVMPVSDNIDDKAIEQELNATSDMSIDADLKALENSASKL